jgi:hypothetical protein
MNLDDMKVALCREDENGNRLHLNVDGEITLKLKGETRNIGTLWLDRYKGYWLYRKQMKEENIFRRVPGWGYCWDVLKVLPSNTLLTITTETQVYYVRAALARATGQHLYFKDCGFEHQFIVELGAFTNFVPPILSEDQIKDLGPKTTLDESEQLAFF